ncbi:hypothetical protein AI28_05125 [bacteria symbiont BFo1 of Frankliniella occidentalis]|nr:hypothetical protein AI28_05125 [bacteria symbiont BFo1 of Frankliniella occidentalis]
MHKWMLFVFLVLLVSGCSRAGDNEYTAGDLRAAHVEWEVDPNPNEYIPFKKKGSGYEEEAYARHKANFQKHSMVVDIPQYGKERCGITVHFLPCNQVKVTAICDGYGTPNYPIKEPLEMKEPAQCPK